MNVKYYVEPKGSHLIFDFNADGVKNLVEQIAEAQEIFEPGPCGFCDEQHQHLRVRTVEKNDFYEIVCLECQATLPLHQNKDGKGLYIERKDKKGNALPKLGWKPPYAGSREPAYAEDGRGR